MIVVSAMPCSVNRQGNGPAPFEEAEARKSAMASSTRLIVAAPSGVSSQMRRRLACAFAHSASMSSSSSRRGTLTLSILHICTTLLLNVLKSPAQILLN